MKYYLNLDKNWSMASQIPHETFKFPAGEVHIKLTEDHGRKYTPTEVEICQRIKTGNDIMLILFAADALRNKYGDIPIDLYIPYFPFSRQDRPMVEGEPFSLRVFVDVLKTGRFRNIYTIDPHSYVTPALVDNLIVKKTDFLQSVKTDILCKYGDFVIVSPDAGALKKVYDSAKEMNYDGDIISANKVRDVNTGKIIRTEVYGDVTDMTVLILDDICSYGGTFKALAKELKELGARNVLLAVTHYEGVANTEELKLCGIDHVYTTNSMHHTKCDRLTTYEL